MQNIINKQYIGKKKRLSREAKTIFDNTYVQFWPYKQIHNIQPIPILSLHQYFFISAISENRNAFGYVTIIPCYFHHDTGTSME